MLLVIHDFVLRMLEMNLSYVFENWQRKSFVVVIPNKQMGFYCGLITPYHIGR